MSPPPPPNPLVPSSALFDEVGGKRELAMTRPQLYSHDYDLFLQSDLLRSPLAQVKGGGKADVSEGGRCD